MNELFKHKQLTNIFFGIFTAIESFILYYLLINVPLLSGTGRFWPYNLMATAMLSVFVAYLITQFVRQWRTEYLRKMLIILGILVVSYVVMNIATTVTNSAIRMQAEQTLRQN